MAKLLRSLLRRTVLGARGNLVSLDDPFTVMPALLRDRAVHGFIDAGSSYGRITRRLLERFPDAQAYLFEANPAFEEHSRQMAAADARIHPNMVALSDEEGTVTLHVTEHPGQTSLFRPGRRLEADPNATAVQREVRVPAVTLDGWAERSGHPPVELLKMDIQAGELAALRGARRLLRESILLVYTELFFNPMYEGGAVYSQIDLALRESGFILYGFYSPKSDERGVLKWADAIFAHGEKLGL